MVKKISLDLSDETIQSYVEAIECRDIETFTDFDKLEKELSRKGLNG